MSEESVRLETEDTGEVLIIRVLNRRIKYEQSSDLGDQLKQAVSMFEGSNVLLDFGIVEYMTSEALGKLVSLKKAMPADGELKIVLTNKNIKEVFKITNLDRIFEVHKTVTKALKKF
ncbi:MAG: STAS domain-containing protein [Planctomycetota bacterium]|jgi:anti-sigma B factor antagonist|nr:STAS domain-containing protein [Planctomycetota bacterium]MDP7253008.1 STAS domain-containing protein [Planctomycetota bacterium]